MPDILVVGLVAVVAGLVGCAIALVLRRSFALASETAARANSERLVAEARAKQKEIILEAKDEALKVAKAAETENRERRAELQRFESRLDKKDEQLDQKVAQVEERDRRLGEREAEVDAERTKTVQIQEEQRTELARVEEMVAKARTEIDQVMKEAAEAAVYEVGIGGLHPDLVKLLGRLHFRTSYGQNVLRHSIEVAHVAGMLASETGYDPQTMKRAGLLHDIGKAIDHEVEGPHTVIGGELLKRYGFPQAVIDGVVGHHGDVEPVTMVGTLISAADAISAARPGARSEIVSNYIQRLQELESVANSFPGVEKSFAIQAGREVRVVVKPEQLDDLQTARLSRDIAQKIQDTLQYPGQVKVTVIRETRAVEYAK